jgi:hypothetical protein
MQNLTLPGMFGMFLQKLMLKFGLHLGSIKRVDGWRLKLGYLEKGTWGGNQY